MSAEKIHVDAGQRGFGLGFGANHKVVFYADSGPKTGPLLDDSQCAQVHQWSAAPDDRRTVTDFIKPHVLAPALANRLLHSDTIEMVQLLPEIIGRMDRSHRTMLFGKNTGRLPQAVWDEIAAARTLPGFDAKNPQAYFAPLLSSGEGKRVAPNGEDITFNGVSMEAAAFIFPMLFESLDEPARGRAAQAIAEALRSAGRDKEFFAPLGDPNLNRLAITDHGGGDCREIVNNGRTIMIKSSEGPRLQFQGDTFSSSNLHFHPLRNADGSVVVNSEGQACNPEFRQYRNARHEGLSREAASLDPQHDVVGELHAIFDSQQSKHALALCAHIKLGEPNEAFGRVIDLLKNKNPDRPLAVNHPVSASELTFDPLACFNNGSFLRDHVPEAPFMSLHLGGLSVTPAGEVKLKDGKSDVFYRGVRVIHLPEPITISPQQLKSLRELQPELNVLDEETCVHPLSRHQAVFQRWLDVSTDEYARKAGAHSR